MEGPDDRHAVWLEVISVLLIALTAVLTAWSAFESSKWGGVMSIRFSEANAARTESVRASNEANAEITVDVSIFTSYANAVAAGDDDLATFYYDRFPDRLAVATDAWLATDPLESPDAPGSPFDMEEYHLEATDRADDLAATADQRSRQARQANQRGDNYTIVSVFFATVILLSALSTKVDRWRVQLALMVGAAVILVATSAVLATYPIEI
jgi:ABC-type nickel/cobalt efflux system permease component RcnA